MSEKHIAPVFTGVVELFFGEFSDLIGSNWHPFDGRVIRDEQGNVVYTTIDPNDTYLGFGATSLKKDQFIPQPNNTLSLGGGSHNHGNGNSVRANWNSSNHNHGNMSGQHTNYGGSYNNSSLSQWLASNNIGSTGDGSANNHTVNFGINSSTNNHNHTCTFRKSGENDGSHNHNNRANDRIVSDSDTLRMPDFTVKLIVFVEGVKYNG